MTTRRWLTLLSAILLTTGVGACSGEQGDSDAAGNDGSAMHEDVPHDDMMHDHEHHTAAEMVDGMQVVEVTVENTGYTPSNISLKAGVPTTIVFNQKADTECASQVQIPDLNIEKTDLPKGERTEITFTPEKEGRYAFTCGMDMLKGTLLVEAEG